LVSNSLALAFSLSVVVRVSRIFSALLVASAPMDDMSFWMRGCIVND
jgi:hypothetical protein